MIEGYQKVNLFTSPLLNTILNALPYKSSTLLNLFNKQLD